MRRSLPAMSAASRSMHRLHHRVGAPTDNLHRSVRETLRAFVLVAGEHDRGSCRDRLGDQRVDEVARLSVETRVGFVEEPEFRPASDEYSERGAATLAR